MMPETFAIEEERHGRRFHFMSGVAGRDLHRAAQRLRDSGAKPIVHSERDGQRIWV